MASLAPYSITLGATDYPVKYAGLLAYIEPYLTNLETFSFSGGNVGLGVTPSAWWSGRKSFQFGGSGNSSFVASAPGSANYAELGSNYFTNSTPQDVYYATGTATRYVQETGAHKWFTAPSGTAGNAITFTQAMTLDANGNLSCIRAFTSGNSTFAGSLNAQGGGSGATLSITPDTISGANGVVYNTSFVSGGNGPHIFQTGGTERARFGSGGEVYFPTIGTTASAANAFLNNASTPANQLLRSTSSLRYKKDIEGIEANRVQSAMEGLRPIWYRSKAEADNKAWSWYGLIAEEVAAIEPRLVHWSYADEDYETIEIETEDGKRTDRKLKEGAELRPDGVQYERLAVLLLAEIQSLRARVASLEAA